MSMMPEVRLTRLRKGPQLSNSSIAAAATNSSPNLEDPLRIITSQCLICGFRNSPEIDILPDVTSEHINHSNVLFKLLDISNPLVTQFFMESQFCKFCHKNIEEMGEKLNLLEKLQREIEDYKSQVDGLIRESLKKDLGMNRPRRRKYQTLENTLKIHIREREMEPPPAPVEKVKEVVPIVIIKEEIIEDIQENYHNEDHYEDIQENYHHNDRYEDFNDMTSSSDESEQEIELPLESEGEDTFSEIEDKDDDFVVKNHHRPDDESGTEDDPLVKVKKNSENKSQEEKLKSQKVTKKTKKVIRKSSDPTPMPTIPCGIEDCPSIFMTLKQRNTHVKKYHTEEGLESAKKRGNTKYNTWKCKRCFKSGLNVIFATERELKYHRMTHSKTETVFGTWTCDICGKTLENSSPDVISKHNLKHFKNNEPGPPTCEICSMKFTSQDDLSTHSLLHKVECPFQCVLCSIVTTSSLSLRQHMLAHHPEAIGRSESHFKCQIEGCEKVLLTKTSLETHMRRHKIKAGEVPGFKCNECNYIGVTESLMKEHALRVHITEKLFQCDLCGNQYKNKRCLIRHLYVHRGAEGGSFKDKCKVCGKLFSNGHTLKLHEEIHSGVSHLCDLCGKSFGTTANLAQHKRTHFRDIYPAKKRKPKKKKIVQQQVQVQTSTSEFDQYITGLSFS